MSKPHPAALVLAGTAARPGTRAAYSSLDANRAAHQLLGDDNARRPYVHRASGSANRPGRTVAIDEAGINPENDAILWKPQQPLRLQPFLYGLFGFGSRLEFDLVPESRTWTCVPEPLVINVSWSDGRTEEHCRLADQVFSVIRVTDPNTRVATATFMYSATLLGASGSSIDYAGGYIGPPYVPGAYVGPYLFFYFT